MKTQGQALADIRRAVVAGFEHTPHDLKLAVNEASIGKSWDRITYNIVGLDGCVDETIQYAAQQGSLTALLSTLAKKYNPAIGPRLRQLAQELKPLREHAASFGVKLNELESIILGDVAFEDAGIWINHLTTLRRAVCRLEPQPQSMAGYGTGFLVAPDVVMTCNHVAASFWNDPKAYERVVCRFDFEKRRDGTTNDGEEYRLDEDWRVYATAVPDFALLRIRPSKANNAEERDPIDVASIELRTDRPLLILQHPAGKPLKLLFGEIADVGGDRVTYKVNTKGGSSGAPCLASDLRATAVHYAAGNCAYTIKAICRQIHHELSDGDRFSSVNQALLRQLTTRAGHEEESTEEVTTSPISGNVKAIRQNDEPHDSKAEIRQFVDSAREADWVLPTLVAIELGNFLMGSPSPQLGRRSDESLLEKHVDRFAIGKFPVTVEEYSFFLRNSGMASLEPPNTTEKNPIVGISWVDAQAYCRWLSDATGKDYRLPTEAEWECAARAGTDTAYWWGDRFDSSKAHSSKSRAAGPIPVGDGLRQNRFGVADALGNVLEWTSSIYVAQYNGIAENNAVQVPESRPFAVRGGSFRNPPESLRCAARFNLVASCRLDCLGFRIARAYP